VNEMKIAFDSRVLQSR